MTEFIKKHIVVRPQLPTNSWPSRRCFSVGSAIFIFFIANSVSIFAERFIEISAEINLTTYARGTNSVPVEKRRKFSLQCTTGTNRWYIHDDYVLNGLDSWYFDGTNVFEKIELTKEIDIPKSRRRHLPTIVPFEQAKSNVTIAIHPSPGGHPLGDLAVNIPWLAYCSGNYLNQKTRVIPLPTAVTRFDFDSLAYVDKTERFEDAVGLPVRVDLFTSKEQTEKSKSDVRMRRDGQKQFLAGAVRQLPDGLLRFRYECLASTNFLEQNFPTEFRFTTYRLTSTNSSIHMAGTGKMLSIRSVDVLPDIFNVPPDKKETVIDARFRDEKRAVDNIVYGVTNLREAPEMSQIRLQTNFAGAKARARSDLIYSAKRNRLIFAILFSAVIMIPIINELHKRYKMKRK